MVFGAIYVDIEKKSYFLGYRVGSEAAWSAAFTFETLPLAGTSSKAAPQVPFSVCIFGDLTAGRKGVLTPYLIDAARQQQFDLIVHTGKAYTTYLYR